MRKLLLLLLLSTYFGYSQTVAQFNSAPGTEFTILSPASTIDQTPSGMNATWTFNDLAPGGTNIDTYVAPTASELTTYPGTTEVLSITTQGGTPTVNELFQREDGTGNYFTGASQGDIVLNYNTTNAFVGLFPLNFSDSNSGTAAGVFTFMGTNGTFTGTFTATVDGYGTLNLSDGASGNYTGSVTRIRVDQNLSFSIPPIFNNIGTLIQTSYYYYDNAANNIVFRYNDVSLVSGFLGVNETTETFERNTPLTLSTNRFDNLDFKVFPNPAYNELLFTGISNSEIEHISIVDITGKSLIEINTYNSESINIEHLKSGLYLLNLEINGRTITRKFLKN